MESLRVLVSGASIAGLSTAYWMNRLGYKVTVVEMANQIRTGGVAVDVRDKAVDVAKRMGIFEQLKENRLTTEVWEFKNASDVTEGSMMPGSQDTQSADNGDGVEIDREKLVNILFDTIKHDVEFIFNDSITVLKETATEIVVAFKSGLQRSFDLVIGCDGLHSGVRKIWFGDETEYSRFLQIYFSVSTVNKLLTKPNTSQMYNVPDKAIMLNTYNDKTAIVFCFFSENEIPYNYRDEEQQRKIIQEQFAGQSWRTTELLEEISNEKSFYFDKVCQIIMPSWTKGRVALVGDAAYCASPASGSGASLAMIGAATLVDALEKHNGNFGLAFQEYNQVLRPYIENVQATAQINIIESFVPRTEEAIRKRNAQTTPF